MQFLWNNYKYRGQWNYDIPTTVSKYFNFVQERKEGILEL
jgi:hypothetical protein